MNTFTKIVLLTFLATGNTAWAQVTLATWTFNAQTPAPTVTVGTVGSNGVSGVPPYSTIAGVTASNLTVGTNNTLVGYVDNTSASDKKVAVSGWASASESASRGISFSISPTTPPASVAGQLTTSTTISLTSLTFDIGRGQTSNPPDYWGLQASLDNFATTITLVTGSATLTPLTITMTAQTVLLGTQFQNITAGTTVSFKIFGFRGSQSANGQLFLDNIRINALTLPLPIKLVRFVADAPTLSLKTQRPAVSLRWETAWERSADRYVVERSRSLAEFTSVGEVQARGTADAHNHYHFLDEEPLEGVSYYRLRQFDTDGVSTISKPVAVRVDSNRPLAVVAPNPASGQRILLRLYKIENPVVECLTVTGQRLPGRLLIDNEQTAHWQPAQVMTPGVYWLTVGNDAPGALRQTLRVLVQ